jgi:hypothetical protein
VIVAGEDAAVVAVVQGLDELPADLQREGFTRGSRRMRRTTFRPVA